MQFDRGKPLSFSTRVDTMTIDIRANAEGLEALPDHVTFFVHFLSNSGSHPRFDVAMFRRFTVKLF